jgi:Zn-dependent protease
MYATKSSSLRAELPEHAGHERDAVRAARGALLPRACARRPLGGTAFHLNGLALCGSDPASARQRRANTSGGQGVGPRAFRNLRQKRACHNSLVERDTQWVPPVATEPAPPVPPAPRHTPWLKRAGGLLVAAAALAIKFGAKLKVLLLALPKLKIFTTSGSMLVSVGAYSLIWGWKFALGFVVLLLLHEVGHVIQLRREGIPASAPLFIPFLGAVISAKSLGGNALAEARVGLAGPVLGSLAAAALLPLYPLTGDELWLALAFTGFLLNLFNLLPVVPLDGGRAMAAMAPWMWFVGFAALVALAVVFPNPIILLIVLLGGLETWRRWKQRRAGDEQQQAYYRIRPAQRLAVAAVYLGLIALLVLGMAETHVERTFEDA